MGISKIIGPIVRNRPKVLRPKDKTLCFEAVEAGSTVALRIAVKSEIPPISIVTSTDGYSWTPYVSQTVITLQNVGDRVWFSAGDNGNETLAAYTSSPEGYSYFTMTGLIKPSGNMTSLLSPMVDGVVVRARSLMRLFCYCKELVSVPDIDVETISMDGVLWKNDTVSPFHGLLVWTSVSSSSRSPCNFSKLSNVKVPLYKYALASAFYSSGLQEVDLSNITDINAECFLKGCFYYCNNLKKIRVGFSSWCDSGTQSKWPTYNWVQWVASTGIFICPEGLPEIHDDSHIPLGWRVFRIPTTPVVPMTVISDYQNAEVYRDSMFNHDIIIKFTESGSVTFANSVTARVLAVGGGGAGGYGTTGTSYPGGGGGGGEVKDVGGISISSGTVTVVVGAGGAQTTTANASGENGHPSTVTYGGTTITALGGGGGGGYNSNGNGGDGVATGGGSSGKGKTGGVGALGENGKGGSSTNSARSGGGGGAGGAGQDSTDENAGDGGAGVESDICFDSEYNPLRYGGGGGGGVLSVNNITYVGSGVDGGGRGGCRNNAPVAGTANTGGGGGGGGRCTSTHTSQAFCGAAGGSGIVIIRITAYQE